MHEIRLRVIEKIKSVIEAGDCYDPAANAQKPSQNARGNSYDGIGRYSQYKLDHPLILNIRHFNEKS